MTDRQPGPFKEFPEFTELKWEHKEEYERLIAGYPPVADISFPALMGWWSVNGKVHISLLNQNVVIRYCSDEGSFEDCLIGVQEIDSSACIILEYLRENGHLAQLYHIPNFTIEHMQYPELFDFKSERSLDEYIIKLSNFYPLENSNVFHRRRVERFVAQTKGKDLHVGPLDLSKKQNRDRLLQAFNEWPRRGINSYTSQECLAIQRAINNAHKLGLHNCCLIIDGALEAFILFDAPSSNTKYVTLEYACVSYSNIYLINFSISIFSEWFVELGLEYMNVCMDYGKPTLRVVKLLLRPISFFRKYTVVAREEVMGS